MHRTGLKPPLPLLAVEHTLHGVESTLGLLGIEARQHLVPGPIGRHRLRVDSRPEIETLQALPDPQQEPRRS